MNKSKAESASAGGDIYVQTMFGHGTDVYINCNHLGDAQESETEACFESHEEHRHSRHALINLAVHGGFTCEQCPWNLDIDVTAVHAREHLGAVFVAQHARGWIG
eukprot:3656709-Amphidinium_carterae.1